MIQERSHEAMAQLSKIAPGPTESPEGVEYFETIWQCEQLINGHLDSYKTQLSFLNWLELQHVRLHVQCLYLLYDVQTDLRLTGVLRAYATASEIISAVLSEPTSHDVLPYAPIRIMRMIFMAALLILRVLHSTSAAGLDYEHGRLLVNAAAFSLHQFSVAQKDKDQPVRASEMLRAFWRAAAQSPTMSSQEIRLRAKSRMGASLLFDSLLRFRDQNATASVEAVSSSSKDGLTTDARVLDATNLDAAHLPRDILPLGTEIDMTNIVWLEDDAFLGFADFGSW